VREIAAELGHGITSNAVIAKIHRLGIARLSPYGGRPGRRSAGKTRAADRLLRGHRAAYWFRKGPPPAWVAGAQPHIEITRADARIPRRQRRSLFELSEHSCRWPIGDPRSSRFFFCGAQPVLNRPYCAEHCTRAYRDPRAPPRGTAPPRHPARPRHPSRINEETAVQTRPQENKNEIKTCAAAQFHQAPKGTVGRAARAADAGALAPRRRRPRAR
jgi:GcrA cell cycle regulator